MPKKKRVKKKVVGPLKEVTIRNMRLQLAALKSRQERLGEQIASLEKRVRAQRSS